MFCGTTSMFELYCLRSAVFWELAAPFPFFSAFTNMAAAVSDFEPWLIEKLRTLNTDEGVFGSYILGILEGEESVDEKKDALEGILAEIVVSHILIMICPKEKIKD